MVYQRLGRCGGKLAALLTALLIAACGGRSDVQLTLVNENLALGTEIAAVRSTATFESDRMLMTQEYIQTAVLRATEQYQVLSLTLVASGLNPAAVTANAAVPPAATQEAGANTGGGASITATPPPGPSLYNVVTSQGVGDNDCALGSTATFSSAAERIYVVATASNVPAGTTLMSRWFNEGVETVTHNFTPDFTIEQNCIWFFIDQTDTPFTPGNWSVQLEMNGSPVGNPVTFTIVQ